MWLRKPVPGEMNRRTFEDHSPLFTLILGAAILDMHTH